MAREIFPSTAKCCCKWELTRLAVAVYITIEIYLWAIMSIAAIFSEFKMIENSRAFKFRNFTQHSTYYAIVFGSLKPHASVDEENIDKVGDDDDLDDNEIGQGIIVTQITFNAFLMFIFVLYFFFAVILLIGISESNLSYFKFYLCLDTFSLYLSLGFACLGILMQHHVMFRNAIVFALKFYPATCVYSLFKKLGGPSITFTNFWYTLHHAPCMASPNPAIRLARSDTEFEESSITKSNEDFSRPRVSFQCDLPPNRNSSDLQTMASEPNISPLLYPRGNLKKETSKVLKRDLAHLQLPVNNSYP